MTTKLHVNLYSYKRSNRNHTISPKPNQKIKWYMISGAINGRPSNTALAGPWLTTLVKPTLNSVWPMAQISNPWWDNLNSSRCCSLRSGNYANRVYGVATICHQVRWLRWGHPSLFHIATSILIWYKVFCLRDTLYRLISMEFINMFSVYAQSGTHSRFNW